MPAKRTSDENELLDLFIASRPKQNEHTLAFTIRFTPSYSSALKLTGERYIAEAYRTVRDLFKSRLHNQIEPITDIVSSNSG